MSKKPNYSYNDERFMHFAEQQGYYYYCTAPGCLYKFLSITDSEHVCLPLRKSTHRGEYYPIQDHTFK